MELESARASLRKIDRVTTTLLRSMQRVTEKCPEPAAGMYRKNAHAVLGSLADIVFALWKQYPELEPSEDPARPYYDPDRFNLPKQEVRRIARELARVASDLEELEGQMLDACVSGEERERFGAALKQARSDCRQAVFNNRQRHPAFRGLWPKEDPLGDTGRKRAGAE